MKKTICIGGLIAMIFVAGWVYRQPLSGQASRSGLVAQKQPLVLTNVANCGVLVSSGDLKILVDSKIIKEPEQNEFP